MPLRRRSWKALDAQESPAHWLDWDVASSASIGSTKGGRSSEKRARSAKGSGRSFALPKSIDFLHRSPSRARALHESCQEHDLYRWADDRLLRKVMVRHAGRAPHRHRRPTESNDRVDGCCRSADPRARHAISQRHDPDFGVLPLESLPTDRLVRAFDGRVVERAQR